MPRVFSLTLVTRCDQVMINVVLLLTDNKRCTLIDIFRYLFAVAALVCMPPCFSGLTGMVCSNVTFSVSVSAADAELEVTFNIKHDLSFLSWLFHFAASTVTLTPGCI